MKAIRAGGPWMDSRVPSCAGIRLPRMRWAQADCGRKRLTARTPTTMKATSTRNCTVMNGSSFWVNARACRKAVFPKTVHHSDEHIEIER